MARTPTVEFLTTQQTADLLAVDRTTVWRFVRDGRLTKYAPPGRTRVVRYRRDEVEGLLRALNTLQPITPSTPARGKGGRREIARKTNGAG